MTAGIGNTFGGVGATVEGFVAGGHASLVAGAGYIPGSFQLSGGGHPAYAVAVRGYLGSWSLRPYVEGSWSHYGTDEYGTFGGPSTIRHHYALGLSAGIRWVVVRGFSLLAGIGDFARVEFGHEDTILLNVGLGVVLPR